MIDLSQQLSELETLASAVDYDMVEYDQAKIDELAAKARDMRLAVIKLFGVDDITLFNILANARAVADTDRDEWEGNNL